MRRILIVIALVTVLVLALSVPALAANLTANDWGQQLKDINTGQDDLGMSLGAYISSTIPELADGTWGDYAS